jgi:1-acyl-sn-glycerol-3-phosphate acyltransferase
VPLAKGEYSVASRALGLATYFLSGALAINISQFLGSPLKSINEDWYNAWIAFTKQSFGLLTMTLTQTFAPTKVVVSGDESVRGQLLKSTDGNLILDFPERLVLMANHQIYTDWLYLWWIAYCNGMHGRLYIILKESLRKIPILGWGMQLNQFIFLKRNWEEDKPNMARSLQRLNKPTDPMWLLLFPEGTNLAPSTREKSAAWAKKNNITDCKHTLLPRSTGLHFCLDELKGSVDYVYDVTVVYAGVPRGQYAQDIFTLKAGYMEGRPPKSVHMHFRRFAVKDIPLHDERAFELWLRARWREKDVMIEEYYRTGKLPADYGGTRYKSGKILRGCGHMEVPIRASHWYEFLQIFAPMGILAMILYIFYGDLPQRFWKSINKQALQAGTQDLRAAGAQAGKGVKSAGSSLGGLTLDDFFQPGKQEETFKAGAMAVQRLITSPQAQTLLNRADFMQAFLSDPQKMVQDTMTDKQQSFMQQMAQEEAKRQHPNISPPAGTGFVRPIPSRSSSATIGTTTVKANKGDFYNQLIAEEQSRRGSVISGPTSKTSKGKGTFWQDLRDAEVKRIASAPAAKTPLTSKNLASKGNFWDEVKKEENNRKGTVVTLSSNATTAVASQRSNPSSTSSSQRPPPKLPPKKMHSGAVKPDAPKVAQGKVQNSVPKTTSAAHKTAVQKPNGVPAPSTRKPGPAGAGSSMTPAAKKGASSPAVPKTSPAKSASASAPKPSSKPPASNGPPKPLAPIKKPAKATSKPSAQKPATTPATKAKPTPKAPPTKSTGPAVKKPPASNAGGPPKLKPTSLDSKS